MIHHPLDFDDMFLLVSISKTKSLTKTAQDLNIAIGNIRKRTAKMEDYFGQPIYTRKSTGVALTRLGEELSVFYEDFLSKFSCLKNNLRELPDLSQQILTIATTQGIANATVIPCLPDFLAKRPNINISLLTFVTERELLESYADLIIWPTVATSRYRFDLKVEPFFTVKFGLFAAKSYIERYGNPEQNNKDNIVVKFFDYNSSPFAEASNELFKKIDNLHIAQELKVNGHTSMLNLVNNGAGIGVVALNSPYSESNHIVQIFPEMVTTADIHLITRKNLNASHPAALFSEHLKSTVKSIPSFSS